MLNSKSSISNKRYSKEQRVETKWKAKSNFFFFLNGLAKPLDENF